MKNSKTKPVITVFDIETTNLKADFGELIHFGWMDYFQDEEAQVLACYDTFSWRHDILDDRDLVEFACRKLDESNVIIGHYSTKFDLPFIQSRALKHGITPVNPSIKHVDTWRLAKYRGQFQRNSMANLCEYFGLQEKHSVPKEVWRRANTGDLAALTRLTPRCQADVEATALLFNLLDRISPTQFNLGVITNEGGVACPHCGSTAFKKKGFQDNMVSKYQRYLCLNDDCGKQFQGRTNLLLKNTVCTK